MKWTKKGKTFRRWMLWLAAITVAEILVFHHYNVQLSANQVPFAIQNKESKSNPVFKEIKNVGPHELQSKLFALSPDGSKFAYVNADNDFYVMNSSTGRVLSHTPLSYKADYIRWFDNSHLFIGTENPSTGNLKNIRFSTYDLTSNSFHLWKVYQGYLDTASLEKVTFSPFTNDTYILLGDSKHSIEYHFDTNNQMWSYHLNGRLVQNWMVSQTTDQLYYQDIANGIPNVWVYDYRTTSSHLIAQDAKLLHMNSNTLYYAMLNNQGNVTEIRKVSDWNKGPKTVLSLQTPVSPDSIYVQGSNFYHVDSGKMTNLQTSKTTNLPKNQGARITSDNLYIMGTNGNVYYYSPAKTSSQGQSTSNANTTAPAGSSNSTGQ